jgi:hypothetical protein
MVNEMQAPANDKKFQDKDDEVLNSARWYIEGLDKRLVRHRVRLVIESRLRLNEAR